MKRRSEKDGERKSVVKREATKDTNDPWDKEIKDAPLKNIARFVTTV